MTSEKHDLEQFAGSAQKVVDYLRGHTPLTDWSVSRIDDSEQVHLHVRGNALLQVGARAVWEETFCRRMLAGAEIIVPDALANASYADLVEPTGVHAYAGVPILEADGSVFGTICGAGAEPFRGHELVDRALLDVFSDLLSSQLSLVRSAMVERRAALVAASTASTDALTGLMNRRGWDLVAADARNRVATLGDHGAVLMIDLDGLKEINDTRGHPAGDALLVAAAGALRGAALAGHTVARLGGDEFGVYVDGAREADLIGLVAHYAEALGRAGVAAWVGAAAVVPVEDEDCLADALSAADARMYAQKALRRSA